MNEQDEARWYSPKLREMARVEPTAVLANRNGFVGRIADPNSPSNHYFDTHPSFEEAVVYVEHHLASLYPGNKFVRGKLVLIAPGDVGRLVDEVGEVFNVDTGTISESILNEAIHRAHKVLGTES